MSSESETIAAAIAAALRATGWHVVPVADVGTLYLVDAEGAQVGVRHDAYTGNVGITVVLPASVAADEVVAAMAEHVG